MKRFAALACVAACTYHNPPPQPYMGPPPAAAQPPSAAAQPPSSQPAAGTTQSAQAGQAGPVAPTEPPRPAEEAPFDPDKDMPKDSVTTDAKLELGTETTVTIDARSDIYSSGAKKADPVRGGVMPSTLTLAPGGGIVSFPKVIGKAGCVQNAGANADGGACAGGNTDLYSAGTLSGIKHHQRTMFLVGVFLGPKLPKKAPPILDFSNDALGTKFPKLEPQLGQVFFIGDGSPGDEGGTHDFVVPKGATRLFLGYADGYGFQGAPGAYGDNKGGLKVTVLQRK